SRQGGGHHPRRTRNVVRHARAYHGRGARRESFPAGSRRTGRAVPGDLGRRRADRGEGAMKLSPIQKRAERASRNRSLVDLNLVSLIDIFTILIFFLLANASEVEVLPSTKAVRLPESTAEKTPKETLVVLVSNEDIVVQGRKVSSVSEAMKADGDVIAPLKAELDFHAGRAMIRKEK